MSFEMDGLVTSCGKKVRVYDTGEINTGDGPDFLNGSVGIESLRLFGSIELHIETNDWYAHGHHKDPRYNNVILHTVFEENGLAPVELQDGTRVPTVCLKPYLTSSWVSVFSKFRESDTLLCSGRLHQLGGDFFEKQLEEAANLYFVSKRTNLISFFDTNLSLEQAWKKMLFLGWCDGLGISYNRKPMVASGEYIWQNLQGIDFDSALEELYRFAGFTKSPLSQRLHILDRTDWDFSGGSPGNSPFVRLRHALQFHNLVEETSFRDIIKMDGDQISRVLTGSQTAGKQRTNILHQTVVLPSIHILGNLLGKETLCTYAISQWKSSAFFVPDRVKSAYIKAGITETRLLSHPGTLYQYRNFCKNGNCLSCSVFKIISGG